ncbi:MAG: zinc ribbon domain-containing protein [Oscillospiraceae bacterium]|nr:zinc ribbon domain-containing protein [Oscillospiraceae bacterium]
MALIMCENCGQSVSDRAKVCPSCGVDILQERLVKCPDCGNEFTVDLAACPKCGCPVENIIAEISQNITSETGKGHIDKKVIMIGVITFTLIVIGIVIAVIIGNSSKHIEVGAKEQSHEEMPYNTEKQEKQRSYPDLFDYGFLDDGDNLKEYGIEADLMGKTYRLNDSAEMFLEYADAWRDNGYYVKSKDPEYEGNRVSWVLWVFSDEDMGNPIAMIIFSADKDVGFATVMVDYL